MALKRISDHISQNIDISAIELETILNAFILEKYPAKTILLKKGQVCEFIGFVVEGCLAYYYKFQKKEQVFSLPRENWWIGDLNSLLTFQPSNLYIKTLEDTKILVLNKAEFDNLIKKAPNFIVYYLSMIHKHYLNTSEQCSMSLALSVEDRYQEILANMPELVNRIPDKYLASVLGVQPPSLSRIKRKKIKKGDS
jgi:CRP-like cAMP-binding protein